VKSCLFAGPTLFGEPAPQHIARFGPAALGSVFRAVELGYTRIGIVDGYFGNTPSIWHKEILFAISEGVEVIGAGSMGALRAAELFQFGMVGIGRIFRLFRSGLWTDDDEVAVIHATEELDFRPLSEAMANIRFTFHKLRRQGLVERGIETELTARLKAKHFSERTGDEVRRQAARLAGERVGQRLIEDFERLYVDAKKRDAQALVNYMLHSPIVERRKQAWIFPATAYWARQFGSQLADIPPLH
jgi:hypothetical protein